jgi:hypothetical protein
VDTLSGISFQIDCDNEDIVEANATGSKCERCDFLIG